MKVVADVLVVPDDIAAVLYSFVRTCERHSIDPFVYLRDILAWISGQPMI